MLLENGYTDFQSKMGEGSHTRHSRLKISSTHCPLILLSLLCLQVGPSYGRRTLTGLLRSQGVIVGEQRVRVAMMNTTPGYIQQRQQHTYHQMNPIPYYAEYFGHKLHFDQNEKLVRFGVTHVAASDGFSGKLLGVISMPTKNCIEIYDQLYR